MTLILAQRVQGATYKDRTGAVVLPTASSDFFARTGAFLYLETDGHLLLSRSEHSNGDWELAGGGVDDGEDLIQGVLRETFEETGIQLDAAALSGVEPHTQLVYYHAHDNNTYWNYTQHFYILKDSSLSNFIFEGVQTSPDGGEAQWIKTAELAKTPLRFEHAEALRTLGILS